MNTSPLKLLPQEQQEVILAALELYKDTMQMSKGMEDHVQTAERMIKTLTPNTPSTKIIFKLDRELGILEMRIWSHACITDPMQRMMKKLEELGENLDDWKIRFGGKRTSDGLYRIFMAYDERKRRRAERGKELLQKEREKKDRSKKKAIDALAGMSREEQIKLLKEAGVL